MSTLTEKQTAAAALEAAPELLVGIDVGSTTVKVVALDAQTGAMRFGRYRRHKALQAQCARDLLRELAAELAGAQAQNAQYAEGVTGATNPNWDNNLRCYCPAGAGVVGTEKRSVAAKTGAQVTPSASNWDNNLRCYCPSMRVAVAGSGGLAVAQAIGAPFVQEVVAGALAVRKLHPQARCAIELGGQDAKMVFFTPDEKTGQPTVTDMRMNGSCAGGTGAFIDEIAAVLATPVEQLDALAAAGNTLHSISGRCGVYAKTDIQPLLNQGIPKADIALSAFHAVAKQTIGGLAQGLQICPPVIFEGGPLTYNPTLISVFAQRLGLEGNQIIVPEHPELIVAHGAALAALSMSKGPKDAPAFSLEAAINQLSHASDTFGNLQSKLNQSASDTFANLQSGAGAGNGTGACSGNGAGAGRALIESDAAYADFMARHVCPPIVAPDLPAGSQLDVLLGIDSGSTTTKLVLLDAAGTPIEQFYASNQGEPLAVARAAMLEIAHKYRSRGVHLNVLGAGCTGYGELMFARAFHADHHAVETVAHAYAAKTYEPDVTFVLDIGGQDMKAIWMDGGVITDIIMNEACSSGCGSFLENFAQSLGIPLEGIAEAAFSSTSPANLGSRCTVFMNSSIVSEQRAGKTPADIMAGLANSIIENVFTKVIRVSNLDRLGAHIVVQGGTFANDAVLAAFENYVGRPVTRAPYPGLMGAIGIALLTKARMEARAAQAAEGPVGSVGVNSRLSAVPETKRSEVKGVAENEAGIRYAEGVTWDNKTAGYCPAEGVTGHPPTQNWDNKTVGYCPTSTPASTFIGFEALEDFSFTQKTGLTCPNCSNHCSLTLLSFSDGTQWVTGNRCPRGENVGTTGTITPGLIVPAAKTGGEGVTGLTWPTSETFANPKTQSGTITYGLNVPEAGDNGGAGDTLESAMPRKKKRPVNLYKLRRHLLFAPTHAPKLAPVNGITIGIPRTLAVWDTAPFWRTLFESLGYTVEFSAESTREMYEAGLQGVVSDTVCFPAKLVHGHVRALANARVDRIFMPIITVVEPEGTATTAESMCAVVKGYPMVMRASDNPETNFGVPFDTPLFHWYTTRDRDRQLVAYLTGELGVPKKVARAAISQADSAQAAFKQALVAAGSRTLEQAARAGERCVVLASRPYQNDPLVNHDIPKLFTDCGWHVLPADALPGLNQVDLSQSRLDIANNFHARMLAAALIAARTPGLEYAQVVSFGCGHDAYLSDEIVRLMHETSASVPLILKVDESTIEGPLRIRVRSFVETAEMKTELAAQNGEGPTASGAGAQVTPSASKELADPYPVKYTAATKRGQATVLVPNTSHAFSRVMAAAFASQGVNAVPLELGRERAIELGKRYVHNDICFPAQIVIGEILAALESGKYDTTNVAVGMGKYVGDCRLTHYSALLRKALDDAGWAHVPIITNDTVDSHNMHPGFKMNTLTAMRIAWALPMIDALEELLRKIRPYELEPGSTQVAFDHALDLVIDGMAHGLRGMNKGFEAAIDVMRSVPYDRAQRRPRVLIVGEYLLNFHPGANRDIEDYLEREGFEIVEARMTDVIRKTYFYKHAQAREFKVDRPLAWRAENTISDNFFELAHDNCDRIARAHALYEPPTRMPELVRESDAIVHHTFDAGEGVLIPAEIIHNARHGVGSFVILQPFGCLPNHIVGRGIAAQLKREFPQARILALDYDPDMSFANIENRLQMLVMGAREEQFNTEEVAEKGRARQACEFIANAAGAAAAAAHGAAGAAAAAAHEAAAGAAAAAAGAAGAAATAAHGAAEAAGAAAAEAAGAAAAAAHGAAEAASAAAAAAANAANTVTTANQKAEQQ